MKKILLFAFLLAMFTAVVCVSASAGSVVSIDGDFVNFNGTDEYEYDINYTYLSLLGSDYDNHTDSSFLIGCYYTSDLSSVQTPTELPYVISDNFNGFKIQIIGVPQETYYDNILSIFLEIVPVSSELVSGEYSGSFRLDLEVNYNLCYYSFDININVVEVFDGSSGSSSDNIYFGLSPYFFYEFGESHFPLSAAHKEISWAVSKDADNYYYYLSSDHQYYIRWNTMDQDWQIRLPYMDGGVYEFSSDPSLYDNMEGYNYGEQISVILDRNAKIDFLNYITQQGPENCYLVNKESVDYKGGYQEGFLQGGIIEFQEGYNAGYDAGNLDGYKSGLSSGKESGYHNGYDEGYSSGYEKGDFDGRAIGYSEGYTFGFSNSDGYKSGYQKGYSDAFSDYVNVSDGNAISGMFQGIYGSLFDAYDTITSGIAINGVSVRSYINTFILIFVVFIVGSALMRLKK